MKKKSAASVKLKTSQPKKSGQVPVTKKMLDETRAELKADITTLRLEIKSGFKQVDARFKQVDAGFKQVDSRFDQMDASMNQIKSEIHRVLAVVEEQNARNIYVLDGYNSLEHRVGQLETSKPKDI